MLNTIECVVCGKSVEDRDFLTDSGFPLYYKKHKHWLPGYQIGEREYMAIALEEVMPNDMAIYFCGPGCSLKHHQLIESYKNCPDWEAFAGTHVIRGDKCFMCELPFEKIKEHGGSYLEDD